MEDIMIAIAVVLNHVVCQTVADLDAVALLYHIALTVYAFLDERHIDLSRKSFLHVEVFIEQRRWSCILPRPTIFDLFGVEGSGLVQVHATDRSTSAEKIENRSKPLLE